MTIQPNNRSTLRIKNNGSDSGQAGFYITGNSTVDVSDFHLATDVNNGYGVYMEDGGSSTLNVNNTYFSSIGNHNHALYMGDGNTLNINDSTILFSGNGLDADYNILNNAADAIRLEGRSTFVMDNTVMSEIYVYANARDGLSVNEGSSASFKNAGIYIMDNGNNDIFVSGGKLDVSNSSNQELNMDFTGAYVVPVLSAKSNLVIQNAGEVNIDGMNLLVKANSEGEKSANILVDDGILNITGNNKNIAVYNIPGTLLTNNTGKVHIENMNIVDEQDNGMGEVFRNDYVKLGSGQTAIETIGGMTSIVGNGLNHIGFMGENGNNAKGFYVAASEDGRRGNMIIKDMDIGLSLLGGNAMDVIDSDVTISSNHNNVLFFNNGVGTSDGGVNLQAKTSNATMQIDGMRLIPNVNTWVKISGSEVNRADLSINNSIIYAENSDQSHKSLFDTENAHVTLNDTDITRYIGSNDWDSFRNNTEELSEDFYTNHVQLVQNAGTSTFFATNSSLEGNIIDNGTLTVDLTQSNWKMANSSVIDTLNTRNSIIDMRTDDYEKLSANNTLTIKNSLFLDNANFLMNTDLSEADKTDKIILTDGASVTGTALLHITNVAPSDSDGSFIGGDGIKVVDAQGSAITGANAFDLVGKKIDTGAYVQELFYQNMATNDESWYLRTVTEEDGGGNKSTNGSFSNGTKPVKTDLANSVAGMPVVALSVVKTINSELRTRLGELRDNNYCAENGAWARGYYKSLEVDENIKNEMNIYGIEAGYDYLINSDENNDTYFGVMAGYAQLDNLKINQKNNHNGKGDGYVPSIGAYLTWINESGWYTDAVVRGFLTHMDITNYSAQGQAISHDADRTALSGSMEAGRRFSIDGTCDTCFILEPKAQVAYTYMPSKNHTTSLGQEIKYDATNSLITRAAVMAGYRHIAQNDMIFEPYVQVGVAYEWLGETDIKFDGAKFTSDVGGATFEGAVGLNARLSCGWHLYGDVNMEQGSVYKSWGGHLGLRYNF